MDLSCVWWSEYAVLVAPADIIVAPRPLLWEAWQLVRQVVGILHPFSEATKQIQGGEGGHISNTLQILRRLENGINMNTFTIPVLGDDKRSETVKFDELAPMVQTMVLELRAELRTRQVAIPVHKLELLACILDPRFPWRLYDDAVNAARSKLSARSTA
ncbi:hypothetical protein NFJ02_30g77590 [Pycnococcus provasolii]